MKRCVHCRQPFEPRGSTLQPTCSPECALAWVKAKPERAEAHRMRVLRQEAREYRERTETPSQAAKVAQRAFNAWVKVRDAGKPCISCGHPDDGTRLRVASHYRPAGPNPALRFDEANVHGACVRCNSWLSGNLTPYRAELINRIGLAEVERLEGPHDLPKRTVEDFRAVTREYRARVREATKRRSA